MAEDDSTAKPGGLTYFQEIAAKAMALSPETGAAALPPLGVWAEDQRGCPNVVLRSALFTAGKPTKKRKLYREHELPAAIGTRSITYTGPQLYQFELDVWLEVVHRCRARRAGTEADFHVHSFLRTLRRSVGRENYRQLHETMGLLHATSIKVVQSDPRKNGYRGHLLEKFVFSDELCRWQVVLDPDIVALFAPNDHTWLHIDARLDLGKNYLAKWLHGYFSSHRKPYPIGVARLRELSGSAMAELRRFRFALRGALNEIAIVEARYGRRFAWRIDAEDLVHVVRESGN